MMAIKYYINKIYFLIKNIFKKENNKDRYIY